MRSRNTVLQALCLLRALDPRISVNEVIAFLYAAESEGLTVQDVAHLAGFTQSTASRSLRALGPSGSTWSQPPALGLVEAYLNPADARSHVQDANQATKATTMLAKTSAIGAASTSFCKTRHEFDQPRPV